ARQADTEWQVVGEGLPGQETKSIIAREGVILAGTRAGVYRSDDGGESWRTASEGLTITHVRWLAYHPQQSSFALAGTEPAAIFVSRDGAESWRECPEVTEMREEYNWYLPYSPRAGCIRGFAIHGSRAYAAAEDGAVLRSDDGGSSWRLAPGSVGPPSHRPPEGCVHSDAHSVAVHPSSAELVMVPTGGGLYRSDDGGETWANLYRCYTRAVWWDPADPQHIVFGPADGVDRNGRIEESRDGGQSWQTTGSGSDAPWPQHMVERLHQVKSSLFAIISNGDLLVGEIPDLVWAPVLPQLGRINDLAPMAS
ncbi:MAG: sialidase family protein, partial [Candidatus Promineifilaceae bacterium]|nr:sialidase family protein [Candidatus Promineifilaceae bacterium]